MPSIYSFTHIHAHTCTKKTYTHTYTRPSSGKQHKNGVVCRFFFLYNIRLLRSVGSVVPLRVAAAEVLSLDPSHSFALSIFLSQSLFFHVSADYSGITHSSIVLLNHGAYPYLLTMHCLQLQPPHGCTTSTTTLQLYLLLVRRRPYVCM